MNFDAGTWWIVGTLVALVVSVAGFLFNRSVFGRADKIEKSIEEIKKDYTPLSVHNKDYDEVRNDIKSIKDNYLTKDDYFREQAKTERKLDQQADKLERIYKLLVDIKGGVHNDQQ